MGDLVRRFEALERNMEKFLEEQKAEWARLRESLSQQSTLCSVRGKDLEALRTKADDHEERLEELEKLAPAIRAVIWVAGVLGVSVVGLIWALITGTAVITFK